jgi:hypothetical protein
MSVTIRPPLWSSGQSSWLQIQRSGFDSRQCQIFWEVMSLERGSLSLVITIEELLGRKSSGSGLESREYGRRDASRWPRGNLYPQKLSLTSPTSGGRSVGIVRSRTQTTEFLVCSICLGRRRYVVCVRIPEQVFGQCRKFSFCWTLSVRARWKWAESFSLQHVNLKLTNCWTSVHKNGAWQCMHEWFSDCDALLQLLGTEASAGMV